MQLKSMKYSQYKGKPQEWRLEDFTLGPINLIVGRNATGKTRTLNIIGGLGKLLAGETPLVYRTGYYEASFDKTGKNIEYTLHYENMKVVEEKLVIDGKKVLVRGAGGLGKIYAEKLGDIDFQAPDDQLACVTRRDTIQHPYFEDLYEWGKNLRHYYFGTQLGKDHFAVFRKDETEIELNLKDANNVVAIFRKGKDKHKREFLDKIKSDMEKIGYDIEDIDVGSPISVTWKGLVEQPDCIVLKEKDLAVQTDQNEISQGMFRALSLIIQLNYSQLSSIPSCILIDDIGEGLDYERSSSLIKLLIEKAKTSDVQLIMSTNDRFVMNNVPLEYWCVMRRVSNVSKVYNYKNAKKRFDDFELTGLSNFDFFTSEDFEEKNPTQ